MTQFYDSPTHGLTNITRYYLQKGKRIDLPTLYVVKPQGGQTMQGFVKPALTEGYCTDIYDRWDPALHPLKQMSKNMDGGMVLAMSAWYDAEVYDSAGRPASHEPGSLSGTQTGMSWLDGVNFWTKTVKAGPCHLSTSDAGGPHHATFSDIRFGDIGTTMLPGPPAPPSPSPTPTPPTPPNPGCPGGTLPACMALCPSAPPIVYKDCVVNCGKRCPP